MGKQNREKDRDRERERERERGGGEGRGGSSFLLRGGGLTKIMTMRSIVHEPRSGDPIFFWGVYFNPVSDVFLASINTMETIKSSA